MLDDGRLTDAQGRSVDFKNTVVIMTSNIGSPHLMEGLDDAGQLRAEVRARVLQELRQHFRPEFLNRVDASVVFRALTRLRAATIKEFDTIARLETQARDRPFGKTVGLGWFAGSG